MYNIPTMKNPITPLTHFLVIAFFTLGLTSCREPNNRILPSTSDVKTEPSTIATGLSSVARTIDKNIRSMYQDKNGNYWIGTNGAGVYRYDSKVLTQFTTKDGLPDNQILSIQEDALGHMWFGTGRFGVSEFDGTKFMTHTDHVSFTGGMKDDWSTQEGDLWFYAGSGVFRYNGTSLDFLPFLPTKLEKSLKNPFELGSMAVYCMLKDRRGNLWFGTQAEGVCKYDGKTLIWFKEKGLAGPAVLAIFEDRNGNLWFGNNGAGLFRYDGKELKNMTNELGLGNADFKASGKSGKGTMARVYAINEDNQGNLWVGTVDAGVWKFDGKLLTNYTTQDGLTSDAVNTIYKDNSGTMWFGTDANGICKFNGSTFTGL